VPEVESDGDPVLADLPLLPQAATVAITIKGKVIGHAKQYFAARFLEACSTCLKAVWSISTEAKIWYL